MTAPDLLLTRLDQIAAALASQPDALALIGLGSVGTEVDRLDEFSDLDFFAIVEPGAGERYRTSLDWLDRIRPLAYRFRNTVHGSKVLYDDGVFCEFAVFEPDELRQADYTSPRIVWQADRFDSSIVPADAGHPGPTPADVEHLVGEALTNLYIGMLRERRGEHMAALRMIQGHALDRVMELHDALEPGRPFRDPFGAERRFEQRHPSAAAALGKLAPGYHHNREAAAAALTHLEGLVDVDPILPTEIRRLLEPS